MDELILTIPEQYPMTDDELFAFCAANKELRIERNEKGQLIVMSPSGAKTGNRNFRLTGILNSWVEQNPELPIEEKAYVYRPHRPVEEISGFDNSLSGESLLPGFELDLSRLR